MKPNETIMYRGFTCKKTGRDDAFLYMAEARLFSNEYTNKPVPRDYIVVARSLPILKAEVDGIWEKKVRNDDVHMDDGSLIYKKFQR